MKNDSSKSKMTKIMANMIPRFFLQLRVFLIQ